MAQTTLEETLDKPLDDTSFEPMVTMAWGSGAKQIWVDLTAKLRDDPDELRRDLFARVPK